jgi:L-galactose dehydrogenase/L-glyceraldehyde 3-phosphate reductase
MTGTDTNAQLATVRRAIDVGINWFDTAPGYGNGASEANLGRVLAELRAEGTVQIATKVRVPPEALDRVGDYICQSVEDSVRRLRMTHVALLQLHNGITRVRCEEPASLTPADILGPVAAALRRLRDDGLVAYFGLTGTGQPIALREVICSGAFDTLQVPFNILNPSAGFADPVGLTDPDYDNIMTDCAALGVGVFAIRVFAGGALLNQPPSAHTLTTPFFPLALYERDLEQARRLREQIADRMPIPELGVRFALSQPAVASAIIGFGSPAHVEAIAQIPLEEPLPVDLTAALR